MNHQFTMGGSTLRRILIAGWIVASAFRCLGAQALAVEMPAAGVAVDFNRDLVPVLQRSCLACHNRTSAKADLVLETPADLRKGGESGPAVVPGKPSESLLIRLARHEEKPVMPPAGNKVNATDWTPKELGLFSRWILDGAKDSEKGRAEPLWGEWPDGFRMAGATALSPDGSHAYVGRGNRIFGYDLRRNLFSGEWSPPDKQGGRPVLHRDAVTSLALHPSGDDAASGSHGEIFRWRRTRQGSKPKGDVTPLKKPGTVSSSESGAKVEWLNPATVVLTVGTNRLVLPGPDDPRASLEIRRSVNAEMYRRGDLTNGIADEKETLQKLERAADRLRQSVTNLSYRENLLAAKRSGTNQKATEWERELRAVEQARTEWELAGRGTIDARTAFVEAAWRLRQSRRAFELAATLSQPKWGIATNEWILASLDASGTRCLLISRNGEWGIFSASDGLLLNSGSKPGMEWGGDAAGDWWFREGPVGTWKALEEGENWERTVELNPPGILVDRVTAMEFSPSGEYFAAASGEPTRGAQIQLWDSVHHTIRWAWTNAHSDSVQVLSFSPDGFRLATGGMDRLVKIWEPASGRLIRVLEGHTGHVLSLGWSPTGLHLVSAGADGLVRVWRSDTGVRIRDYRSGLREIMAVGLDGESMWLVSVDPAGRWLNGKNEVKSEWQQVPGFPTSAGYAVGPGLIALGGDDGSLRIWRSGNARPNWSFLPR